MQSEDQARRPWVVEIHVSRQGLQPPLEKPGGDPPPPAVPTAGLTWTQGTPRSGSQGQPGGLSPDLKSGQGRNIPSSTPGAILSSRTPEWRDKEQQIISPSAQCGELAGILGRAGAARGIHSHPQHTQGGRQHRASHWCPAELGQPR